MTVSSAGAIKELVGLQTVFGVHGTSVTTEMVAQYKESGARGTTSLGVSLLNPSPRHA